MEELKQAVATAFDNVVASGAIEKAIHEQIGKCVESAIRDQFSTYGDFSKAIKAKVASLVDLNLDEIDLPSYRDLVSNVIKTRVGAVMTTQFTELLDKDISELLEPAPAEITLEQLLKDFVKHQMDQGGAYDLHGQDFTLYIQRSESSLSSLSDYVDIYISKESNAGKYSCEIQIGIKGEGEVWKLKVGGKDMKDQLFVGPIFSFEKRLFQMYTAKTRLILPAEACASDYDTTFPYPGEDN